MTRDEIMARARSIWAPGSVAYDMGSTDTPTHHRADCSGWVSAVLGLPAPGLTTVTLVTSGTVVQIAVDDLLPGDLVGRLGRGTDGADGHVTIFERWANNVPADSRYWGWEQAGGTIGPVRRLMDWPDGYTAWRYRGIGGIMAGSADAAFSQPYTGTEPVVDPRSWVVLAIEHPLNALLAAVARIEAAVARIEAAVAARPGGTAGGATPAAVVDEFAARLQS